MTKNRIVTLAARPVGWPKESDFRLVEEPLPKAADGEIVIQSRYLSLDPYMRGRMNDRKSYAEPVKLGGGMTGEVVGRVVESRSDRFKVGDTAAAMCGWQEFGSVAARHARKVNADAAPVSTALGVLGMPGLTAWFGLMEVGRLRPGETVFVSGAAGAVGATVGQIAKLNGCRAVGIAGTDDKVAHLVDELGFDAAFNYRHTKDYLAALREQCPNGIDVSFDNVGGEIGDAALIHLNQHGRVVICGQSSQYNLDKPEMGPRLLWSLIVKRARIEGFLVSDFASRFGEALPRLTEWVLSGQLKYREHIVDGLENAPRAFIDMLRGKHVGKQLVRVSE